METALPGWVPLVGWTAGGCLLLLVCIGAWSFVKWNITDKKSPGADSSLPRSVNVLGWILAGLMVICSIAWLTGKMEYRDHMPQPTSVRVVLPVTTTDTGSRVMLVEERHGWIIPITCEVTVCDAFAANDHLLVDTYVKDGVSVYENPRKQ